VLFFRYSEARNHKRHVWLEEGGAGGERIESLDESPFDSLLEYSFATPKSLRNRDSHDPGIHTSGESSFFSQAAATRAQARHRPVSSHRRLGAGQTADDSPPPPADRPVGEIISFCEPEAVVALSATTGWIGDKNSQLMPYTPMTTCYWLIAPGLKQPELEKLKVFILLLIASCVVTFSGLWPEYCQSQV